MFPLGAAQTEAAFCIFDTVRLVAKSLFALSVYRFDTSRVDFRRSASPNFVALLIRFRSYQKWITVAATSAAICKVTAGTRSNKIMVITVVQNE